MRLIRVAPGIGDNIWLLQKLINAGEKFDFHMSDSFPQRGKQIFDLLPQVSNSCTYVPGLKYNQIRETSKQYDNSNFSSINEKAFSLAINYHLENGRRIEDYLPDLKMTYRLPYKLEKPDFTRHFLAENASKHIGIYMSAYSTNRSWGFWNANQWFDFIQKIHAELPDARFYIIGAAFDTDLALDVIHMLRKNNIPFITTIGEGLSYVVELLQRLDYFIGFPSGLSILNETLHKKTFMFYPPHLKMMMYAWPEESRIKSLDYIAQLFCTPLEAFTILADQAQLF